MYFVNGYKFHTRAWSEGKKTTNSGVRVKGVTKNGEDDFYGVIQHIYELEYYGLPKIALFYCQWYDPTSRGTRVHPQYKIVEINTGRRHQYYDPFIVAPKGRQVYYVHYPETCRDLRGWCVAISTKPRGHIEVDDIIQETQPDESPYQADEPILPSVEIEPLRGLVDENVREFDRVVDSIPEPVGDNRLSFEDEVDIEFQENVEDDNLVDNEDIENDDDDDNDTWGDINE